MISINILVGTIVVFSLLGMWLLQHMNSKVKKCINLAERATTQAERYRHMLWEYETREAGYSFNLEDKEIYITNNKEWLSRCLDIEKMWESPELRGYPPPLTKLEHLVVVNGWSITATDGKTYTNGDIIKLK